MQEAENDQITESDVQEADNDRITENDVQKTDDADDSEGNSIIEKMRMRSIMLL